MAHLKKYDRLAPMAARLKRTMSAEEAGAMLGVSESRLRRVLAKAQRDAAMPP